MSDRRVAVVAGARTPFARIGGALATHTALDLSVHAVDGLLGRSEIDPDAVDQLVWGIVAVDPRVPHLAREVAFASRLAASTRSVTVTDNCITSITGIEAVATAIASGRAETGIAGGAESMSNPAMVVSRNLASRLVDFDRARGTAERLKTLAHIRPGDLVPRSPSVTEPSTGLTMGEHCEIMVKDWGIPRIDQDEIALRSQMRAAAATEDGRLPAEIVPMEGLDHDPIIRAGTTLEKLSTLPPVFDRSPAGTLSAGNSSPLTDGAAAVLLMSEERAGALGAEPLAYLRAVEFASIDPADGLLMGPGVAVPRILERTGLDLDEIDLVEMHEAFGGQVACNLAAWERGWKERAIGTVDPDRLNVNGSSIAVGHPFAATGARIVTTLANEMARREARLGLVSVCGAGATAAALVLERP